MARSFDRPALRLKAWSVPSHCAVCRGASMCDARRKSAVPRASGRARHAGLERCERRGRAEWKAGRLACVFAVPGELDACRKCTGESLPTSTECARKQSATREAKPVGPKTLQRLPMAAVRCAHCPARSRQCGVRLSEAGETDNEVGSRSVRGEAHCTLPCCCQRLRAGICAGCAPSSRKGGVRLAEICCPVP